MPQEAARMARRWLEGHEGRSTDVRYGDCFRQKKDVT